MTKWSNKRQNCNPPWVAIRAILEFRLVGMDKESSTHPVGIGEIFCHLWAKITLKVVRDRAMAAWGNLNLCTGLSAGIGKPCTQYRWYGSTDDA